MCIRDSLRGRVDLVSELLPTRRLFHDGALRLLGPTGDLLLRLLRLHGPNRFHGEATLSHGSGAGGEKLRSRRQKGNWSPEAAGHIVAAINRKYGDG